MKPEIKERVEKSLTYCIKAINEESNKEEDNYVYDTFTILMQEPYEGAGLGIGHVFANYPFCERNTWEIEKHNHIRSPQGNLWMLFDWANLNDKEMYEYCRQIKGSSDYNFTLQHIIENLVDLGEIEKIKEYIPLFRPDDWNGKNDNQYEGYRSILRYYAKQGDSDNFIKTLKFCNARTLPDEIAAAKALLVQAIYRKEGMKGVLRICEHKKIGKKFYSAIIWDMYAWDGNYNTVKKLFNEYPQLKEWGNEGGSNTELQYQIRAFEADYREGKETDDDFEELFERAIQVDPTIKNGIFKLRDSLLWDLAITQQNNKERYMRCKKAIKSNMVKKELPY